MKYVPALIIIIIIINIIITSLCLQTLASEMTSKEADLHVLLDKGRRRPGGDAGGSDRLWGEWRGVKAAVGARGERLRAAAGHADRLQAEADGLAAWLQLSGEKCAAIWPHALRKADVTRHLTDAQVGRHRWTQYNAIQYHAIQYHAIQYNTIQYNTMQ